MMGREENSENATACGVGPWACRPLGLLTVLDSSSPLAPWRLTGPYTTVTAPQTTSKAGACLMLCPPTGW